MEVLQGKAEKSRVPIELLQEKQKRSGALGGGIRNLGRGPERVEDLKSDWGECRNMSQTLSRFGNNALIYPQLDVKSSLTLRPFGAGGIALSGGSM